MKTILLIVVIILFVAVCYGWYRTYKTQHSSNEALFLKGTTPNNLDGLFKGSVTGYNGPWQGKKFDASTKTGINIFKENDKSVEKYPFKTYVAKGIKDPSIEVLKIDYNVSGNPLWLRFVLDELVETSPGQYLGKLNIRTIPGLTFALGYFRLEK